MIEPSIRKKAATKIEQTMKANGLNVRKMHEQARKAIGTNLSVQTYYRVFDPSFVGNISTAVLIEVAYMAGCSKNEIIEMLKEMGDKLWPCLIVPEMDITPKEKALLKLVKEITALDKNLWQSMTDHLALLCRAVRLNRDQELDSLKE